MKRLITTILILVLFILKSEAQCFTLPYEGNGVDQMNIYFSGMTVNGANLEAGDEIGIFDGEVCVGLVVLTTEMLELTLIPGVASRDDQTTVPIDGYIIGHTISYRLCIDGGTVVNNVQPSYAVGTGIFEIGATAVVSLTGTTACANPPTITLSSTSGSTCVDDPITISGNTFINATAITITENGAGSVTPSSVNSSPFSFTYTPDAADAGNIVTITLISDNPSGVPCVSDTEIFTVTVNPLPSAAGTITGPASVCQGATSVAYSVSAISSATSYTWSFNGTGATINGSTNSITIDFATNATSGNLTVSGTNTCGSGIVSANYPIAVIANVTPTFTQLGPYCLGSTPGVLPTTSTNGITGSWFPTAISTSSAGTTVYTFTPTAGQCTTMTTMSVVVNALPTVSITGSSSICIGSTTTLSPTTGGAWVSSNPSVATVTSAGLVTGVTAGTTTFTFTSSTTNCNSTTPVINVAATNAVGAASSTPTLCINTALTPITHTTTGATDIGAATGLPAGVSASWAANTITISGTPSASGTFNYTIPLAGGCGTVNATGTITVTPVKTVSVASSTPTLCINTLLATITHTTSGATGIGAPSNLPAGVSASWAANTITITGTPSAAGTFNYTIPLTGGCGSVNATGSITVTPANTIALTSGVGTNNQTVCSGTAITNITYSTTGAAGAMVTGLPAGVNGNWSGGTVTISGTPTAPGTFGYTVTLTGGCGAITANGTINVSALPVTLVITGSTTPACGATGVPYSVTSTSGSTYTWTVPAGATVATGQGTNSITVNFGISNGNIAVTETNTSGCEGTTQSLAINLQGCGLDANFEGDQLSICVGSSVTFTNTSTGTTQNTTYNWNFGAGATPSAIIGIGPHTVTYSTTGTKTVSLTITDGASDVETKVGYITVNPANSITLTSAVGTNNQTVCANTVIATITYSTTGATGATVSGLPTGVNAIWSANVVMISGTPSTAGTYNYTVNLTGGCGNVTANGTINANVCTKTLNLTVFLESLYNGSNGLFKVQDCDDGENSFDIFPGLISDTLTVELAQTTSPYTTVYSQHGVPINTNGTISLTSVPGGLSGNYHIVVKHRNHIETWSQVTSFAGSTVNYNFTDAISKVWGNNMVLTGSVYCIHGGDANRDQYVDGVDLAFTFNNNRLGSFGYQLPDINGDGFVDGLDLARVFNNNRKGVGMNTPIAPLKKK